MTRRRLLSLFGGLTIVAVLEACQSPQAPATAPTAVNPLIKPKPTSGAELTPVLASSELALGRNRFAVGLIDKGDFSSGTSAASSRTSASNYELLRLPTHRRRGLQVDCYVNNDKPLRV